MRLCCSKKNKHRFSCDEAHIRGAIQKFVDKRKEINTNGWIHLKIYKYIYWHLFERYSNFIEKYQLMSTLQAINCCHVQRCAAHQISNDVAMSVFLEIRTFQRFALAMSLNPLTIYLIKPLHVQFIFQYPVNSPVTHVTKKFMHSYAPVYIQTMLHQLNVTCFRFWHRAAASIIVHYRFPTFHAQLMPFVYQRPHKGWF